MSISDKPLLGIIGAGYWGKNLVRNFYRLGSVKSLFDENPAVLKAMTEDYPGISAASGFQEILADPELSGIVLATPAATHYQLARQALDAGKHVFVEKPLALAREEGQELLKLAEDKGLVLMVDHLLQQHPAYLRLREIAEEGGLGKIRHIHSRRLSFGKIRTEEDAWWSFAPHDISMILGLMSREPLSVSAKGEYWLSQDLADKAEARLDFGGGVSAQVSVGWLSPEKEHRLLVVGEKKMAVFDDTRPWPEKLILYPHHVEWLGQKPAAVKGMGEPISLLESEPLAAQARDFIAAMEGRKHPVTGGREALAVLSVLEAGAESMKNGAASIAVSGKADKYYVHPTAIIDEGAQVGDGCKIWHFSHVLSGSELGANCNLGQNVVVGPKVKVGRGVKIQNNVSVYEGVTLEDDVFCGPSMVFTNVFNPRANIVRKAEYRPTLVKRGAAIGANATVICGHTLGQWCFVGAGAVVTADVPAHALMAGNPARRIGWMCCCGHKLLENMQCPSCGQSYQKAGDGLAVSGDT